MNYTITGTDNEFQNDCQVENVIEKDLPYLENTFKILRPIKKIPLGELESVHYEMILSYGFRMLKEESIYKNTFIVNRTIKRTRYFSRIKTKFSIASGVLKCFFAGVDDSFSCLHVVEGKCVQFFTQLKHGSICHIVFKEEYEAMIKQATVAIRLNPAIYG